MAEKPPGGRKWERAELMAIYALGALFLAALGALWLRQQGWLGAAPAVVHAPDARLERPIEINTAKASDLMQVRGIGERRAEEILFRRDARIRWDRGFRTTLLAELRRDRITVDNLPPIGFWNVNDFIAGINTVAGLDNDIRDRLREVIRVVPIQK